MNSLVADTFMVIIPLVFFMCAPIVYIPQWVLIGIVILYIFYIYHLAQKN